MDRFSREKKYTLDSAYCGSVVRIIISNNSSEAFVAKVSNAIAWWLMKTFKILGSVFVSYYKKFVTGRRKRKKGSLHCASLLCFLAPLWCCGKEFFKMRNVRWLVHHVPNDKQLTLFLRRTLIICKTNWQKKLAKRDHMVVSAKNRIIEVLLCFCPGARAFFTILTLP